MVQIVIYMKYRVKEMQTLPDSAECTMKINQSFYVLMNKFEKKNLPIILNVVLNVSLIVAQNLPDSKMQMLAAL